MKLGAFNQEKALVIVGAFPVIVKTDCETDGALHSITQHPLQHGWHLHFLPTTEHNCLRWFWSLVKLRFFRLQTRFQNYI